MPTWARMAVFFAVSIGCSIAGIIYYRIGRAHIFPLARNEFSGPMSSSVEMLDVVVPVALVAILFGTGLWALGGGVQEERARVRR
jgi:hypothetical protein